MLCQNTYVSIFLLVRNVLESDVWTKEDRNVDVLARQMLNCILFWTIFNFILTYLTLFKHNSSSITMREYEE